MSRRTDKAMACVDDLAGELGHTARIAFLEELAARIETRIELARCDRAAARQEEAARAGYRCQFCGKEAPAKKWKHLGQQCPYCQCFYNPALAQDSP